MSVMIKLSLSKSLDVCYLCVDYLVNRCLREKGLFRNPPSVVEIRKLRTHLLDERQSKAIKDSVLDPHLVAGVLQLTLKDMPISVFSNVYDDMMASSNESADFTRNKNDVIAWMCKFDSENFTFVKTLIAFIHQLGTTPGNDANISQLVFIFAPLLCRPANSAYMSVRHMEDLRKLRPTLQVIVENYIEIFNQAKPCSNEDGKSSSMPQLRSSNTAMELYSTDINKSSSSDHVSYSPRRHSNLPAELVSHLQKKKPALNLQVVVSHPNDVNDASLNTVATRQVNFQSKEWNRLEQMVFSMSELFLKEPFPFFNPSKSSSEPSINENMIMSNENDLLACTLDTFDAGNIGFGEYQDSPNRDLGDNDNDGYWNQSGNTVAVEYFSRSGNGRRPISPSSGSWNGAAYRASTRRKMVHECRSLRQQITKYEKDFSLTHNRTPKGQEKGPMQPIYSKYRDMKREIRSSAAVDIQRVIRAFTCRSKLRKKNINPLSPSRFARSPPRSSSSPSRGSLMLHEKTSPTKHGQSGSLRGDFDHSYADSNVWKSSTRGSADSADFLETAPVDSPDAQIMYANYKDLLLQKRTLKRRLKRFDEEFAAKHHRQPKKTDKEVMRPHYQKYHEVRNEMQTLRAKIEREMGALPAELQEVPEVDQHHNRPNSEPSSDSGGYPYKAGERMEQSSSTPSLPTMSGGGEEDEELMTRYELQQVGDGKSPHSGESIASNGHASAWLSASPTGAEGIRSNGLSTAASSSGDVADWSRATSNNPADMEALQKEKRQLHIVLKAYERDFNQIHGRHVMKPEDIAPVAGEYQRYKELKKRLKDV